MIGMEQYRVRLWARVDGVPVEALDEWLFGTLDRLVEDPEVVDADVAAALAAGDVEFDLQVRGDGVEDALRVGTDALRRAAAVPAIRHAEVELVAVPA